jgi:hypothetical protein
MADKKISALTAAATPLAGTEVFPIVQSSATVKATIANVQAAPVAAGTANGVQYLNASKVPSTGTQLNFDSTNLGLGAIPTLATACTNFELPFGATMSSRSNTAAPQFAMMSNAVGNWYDATYKIDGFATRYVQQGFDGGHVWSSAASGTAGNAISFLPRLGISQAGDVTVNTGNLIIGTSGKGIDFSATPGTGTSELLNDYEEGTWTPVANGITYAAGTVGKYTKVGNLVTCTFNVIFPTTADASNAQIQGLPFTSGSTSAPTFGNYSSGFNGFLSSGNTFFGLVNTTGTAFITNATLSGQTLIGSITYQV